jgi:hypothetical protein
MIKIFLGLAIFLGLVASPVWYGKVFGKGTGQPPELAKPVEGKQCIEPTTFMRANHMELLNSWRDDVVRNGQRIYVASDGARHDMSLTGTCLRCHEDPAKFCIRCHEYSGVEAFCWDCHQQKRSGSL